MNCIGKFSSAFFVLFLSCTSLNAQQKIPHVGLKLGMNINTISEHAEGMSVSYSSVNWLMGGIIYELPIVYSLSLELGIIYNGIGASTGQ